MNRYLRAVLVVVLVVQAFFTVAFALRFPFAVQLWPLPYTDTMSLTFVASIFAAAAAATLWCVLVDDPAALAGLALDYIIILAPTGGVAAQMASGSGSAGGGFAAFAAASAAAALLSLVLFVWAVRLPFRDARPMPRPVQISFVVFVVVLLVVGFQLVQGSQVTLPWEVTTEVAIIYGWFFIGAAAYFVYGLLRPRWHNAAGQLAGFLAYDLVLIVPFLLLLPGISDERRPHLLFYVVSVTYSGLLAAYYLFLAPATGALAGRMSGARPPRGSGQPVGVPGA